MIVSGLMGDTGMPGVFFSYELAPVMVKYQQKEKSFGHFASGINGILADEMGLGKTIQTVALFCHLYEMGVPGPFLVVAPLSTVPNWVNEFKRFAPTVPVVLYHGNANERIELRSQLRNVVKSPELDGKSMMKVEEVLPEKRKRATIDYSVFLDEKEFKNDEKFEEHIAKLNEYYDKFNKSETTGSAYTKELERLAESHEKNFSMKSRMADMRKTVNHPYLIEYPITEDGMFYDAGPDMVDICGKLQVLDQMMVKLIADGHKTLIFSQVLLLIIYHSSLDLTFYTSR